MLPTRGGIVRWGIGSPARRAAGEGDPCYTRDADSERGPRRPRWAVVRVPCRPRPPLCAGATGPLPVRAARRRRAGWLLPEAVEHRTPAAAGRRRARYPTRDLAASSEEDEAEASRLIALVELARKRRRRGVRPALRPLPRLGLPLPLLPGRLGRRWPRTSPPRRSSGRCAAWAPSAGRARTSAPG